MNVAELLTRQAAERPDAPAITETRRGRDRTVSFADLDCRSFCVAANLLEGGLAPGDRVLVFHPMGIDLYVALVAVIRARVDSALSACRSASPSGRSTVWNS